MTAFDRQPDRELDIVVYGATGFVGKLVADYLVKHSPADIKIGLAGRSPEKLDSSAGGTWVLQQSNLPLIIADADDPVALKALAERARASSQQRSALRKVRPSTSSRLRRGRNPLRRSHRGGAVPPREHRRQSRPRVSTGARIVHSCGFDSVPSDLGVHVLHRAVETDGAGEMTDTTLVVTSVRGGISGGTIDSVRNQIDTSKVDARARKFAASPYSLSPDREQRTRSRAPKRPHNRRRPQDRSFAARLESTVLHDGVHTKCLSRCLRLLEGHE